MSPTEPHVASAVPPPAVALDDAEAAAGARARRLRTACTRLSVAAWAVASLALIGVVAVPHWLGYHPLVVRSGSMAPAIPAGSLVYVRPVPSESLVLGDVITFRRNAGAGAVTTHRIVRVLDADGRVFETRGDANPASDPEPVQYVGPGWKVMGRAPYAGYFVAATRHPLARVALAGVPLAIVAAAAGRQFWKR